MFLQISKKDSLRILKLLDVKITDLPEGLRPFLNQEDNELIFTRPCSIDIAYSRNHRSSSMIILPEAGEEREQYYLEKIIGVDPALVTRLGVFINIIEEQWAIMARRNPYPVQIPITKILLEQEGSYYRFNLNIKESKLVR